MNQIFLKLSHLSDPDEIATLTKVVEEAAAGQRSIISRPGDRAERRLPTLPA